MDSVAKNQPQGCTPAISYKKWYTSGANADILAGPTVLF